MQPPSEASSKGLAAVVDDRATTFERKTVVAGDAQGLFDYHKAPRAFLRLSPPWERATVVKPLDALENGATAELAVGIGPATISWTAIHSDVEPGRGFVDVQRGGPFASYRHVHRFSDAPGGAELRDTLHYTLPFGPFGKVGAGYVEDRLDRVFRFRHDTTRLDRAFAAALPPTAKARLRIGITGASGLIGSEVQNLLSVLGHELVPFVRKAGGAPGTVHWDAESGQLGPGADGLDVVIHLAGESIAGRLSDDRKQRVMHSRDVVTRRLMESLGALKAPPRAVVSASAIGFYGDRGDAVLDEDSPAGQGFLPDVCQAWEAAAATAKAFARVVHLRIGVVLSPQSGALSMMLPAFQTGAGGPLGPGTQFMSLISIDDMGAIVARAVLDDRLQGPVNAVGPEPLTNRDFSKTMGRVLSRPSVVPVPAFALRALFGDLADEGLLASARVVPKRLQDIGHSFRHDDVDGALRHVLGRAAVKNP